MVAAYIALFISLICVVFLIVVLLKIKNKFEAKDIVEKSQIYMERMIADMNKNAMRDIDLINQNSKQLRELLLQVENSIKSYNEATDRLRAMIGEAERLETNKNVAPLKTISQMNKEKQEKVQVPVDIQKTPYTNTKKEAAPVVYTKPVITKPATSNYIDVSHSKRTLSDKVNELFAKGYPVEEIAKQLSCSVTEVQTIIDLGI